MIDEFNLIITGTACHIHLIIGIVLRLENTHGVQKHLLQGYNATNGIQNFNTTFHLWINE